MRVKYLVRNYWKYRKSSIKPPGDLFISNPFEGGLKRRGAYLREGAYLI